MGSFLCFLEAPFRIPDVGFQMLGSTCWVPNVGFQMLGSRKRVPENGMGGCFRISGGPTRRLAALDVSHLASAPLSVPKSRRPEEPKSVRFSSGYLPALGVPSVQGIHFSSAQFFPGYCIDHKKKPGF